MLHFKKQKELQEIRFSLSKNFYQPVLQLIKKTFLVIYHHGAGTGFLPNKKEHSLCYQANVRYKENEGIFKLFRDPASTVEFLKKV